MTIERSIPQFVDEIMKLIIAFFVVFALFCFAGAALATEPGRELIVLYTGDTFGHVEPCG